jgi:hypothetical protein
MTTDTNYYATESPWLISKQLGWEAQITNADLPNRALAHPTGQGG